MNGKALSEAKNSYKNKSNNPFGKIAREFYCLRTFIKLKNSALLFFKQLKIQWLNVPTFISRSTFTNPGSQHNITSAESLCDQ